MISRTSADTDSISYIKLQEKIADLESDGYSDKAVKGIAAMVSGQKYSRDVLVGVLDDLDAAASGRISAEKRASNKIKAKGTAVIARTFRNVIEDDRLADQLGADTGSIMGVFYKFQSAFQKDWQGSDVDNWIDENMSGYKQRLTEQELMDIYGE